MDWQSRPGEMYEGILVDDTVNRRTGQVLCKGAGPIHSFPTACSLPFAQVIALLARSDDYDAYCPASLLGNPNGRVAFGDVGASAVDDKDEVFIVIAPQSMTGASVYDPLSEMVTAAKGRPMLLINPRLKDRPSSGAVMQVWCSETGQTEA